MTTALTRNSTTPVAKYDGSRSSPRIKLDRKAIVIQHPDAEAGERLLAEALGAVDRDALHGILKQLMKASVILQKPNEDNLAFMISMVKGIAPRDSLEAMLTAQMVSVHVATMRSASRLACTEGLSQQEGISRTLTRLARTFAAQMEALNRHRGNGERPITVQNLSVQDGGSAIVGNVAQHAHLIAAEPSTATEAGPVPSRDIDQRDRIEAAQGARHDWRARPQHRCNAIEPALPRPDPQRPRLPRAGDAWQPSLPHARRRARIRRAAAKPQCAQTWRLH